MSAVGVGIAVGLAWLALRKGVRRASRHLDGRQNRPKAPELYPGLSDEELAQPFDRELAQALEEALCVRLTTLRGSDAVSEPVAFYLTRVLYRDLMLVPGVSACLAPAWRERAPGGPDEVDGDLEPSAWVLGGELSLTKVEAGGSAREQNEAGGSAREQKNDVRLTLWGVRGNERFTLEPLRAADLSALLACAREALGRKLELFPEQSEPGCFEPGRPSATELASEAGALLQELERKRRRNPLWEPGPEIEARALALLAREPQLSSLAEVFGPHRAADLLSIYRTDPFHLELCIRLHEVLWSGRGYERTSFQFLRRALALAPAHARANRLAAAANELGEHVGHHLLLAYKLSPKDSACAALYAEWLIKHTNEFRQAASIARAAADLTPSDPRHYECLIRAYCALHDDRRALETAHELMGWYDPLHPQTRAFLSEDPVLKKELELGTFDPAARLRERIEEIEAELKRTS